MLTDARSFDVAFVFGAGASKPWLPTQTELIDGLWKATSPPYAKGVPINRLWQAKAYLKRTFPGLPHNSNVNFEDIVGPLEISEAEEYWYHYADRGRDGCLITNRAVLDALDTWLAYALDPAPVPKKPSETGWESFFAPGDHAATVYARLVALLGSLGLLERTVFISLNYDVLFDRCLLASGTHSPDYRIEAFFDQPRPASTPVPLLKVHGSLNWRVCEACHVLVDIGPAVIWPASRCPQCGEKRARPMLIRPTLLKDFRHRVWQDVWREAGRSLALARKWVFVGYSLPLADVWMLRLLAQSLRSGIRDGSKREISVVDPNPETFQRFRLIFKDAEASEGTFGEWWERCRDAGRIL